MLFDWPLASFTTNIFIQNAQTITRQDLKLFVQSFAFENNLLPHTMQQFLLFKFLPHPSKLQEEKWQEKLSQILNPLLFSKIFSCFFSFAILEWKTNAGTYQQLLASNLNLQNMHNKMPLCLESWILSAISIWWTILVTLFTIYLQSSDVIEPDMNIITCFTCEEYIVEPKSRKFC